MLLYVMKLKQKQKTGKTALKNNKSAITDLVNNSHYTDSFSKEFMISINMVTKARH